MRLIFLRKDLPPHFVDGLIKDAEVAFDRVLVLNKFVDNQPALGDVVVLQLRQLVLNLELSLCERCVLLVVHVAFISAEPAVELMTDGAKEFNRSVAVELTSDLVIHFGLDTKVQWECISLPDSRFVKDPCACFKVLELHSFLELIKLVMAAICMLRLWFIVILSCELVPQMRYDLILFDPFLVFKKLDLLFNVILWHIVIGQLVEDTGLSGEAWQRCLWLSPYIVDTVRIRVFDWFIQIEIYYALLG
jgi:hypothetical protein